MRINDRSEVSTARTKVLSLEDFDLLKEEFFLHLMQLRSDSFTLGYHVTQISNLELKHTKVNFLDNKCIKLNTMSKTYNTFESKFAQKSCLGLSRNSYQLHFLAPSPSKHSHPRSCRSNSSPLPRHYSYPITKIKNCRIKLGEKLF